MKLKNFCQQLEDNGFSGYFEINEDTKFVIKFEKIKDIRKDENES
jgi:hypothetical protein